MRHEDVALGACFSMRCRWCAYLMPHKLTCQVVIIHVLSAFI